MFSPRQLVTSGRLVTMAEQDAFAAGQADVVEQGFAVLAAALVGDLMADPTAGPVGDATPAGPVPSCRLLHVVDAHGVVLGSFPIADLVRTLGWARARAAQPHIPPPVTLVDLAHGRTWTFDRGRAAVVVSWRRSAAVPLPPYHPGTVLPPPPARGDRR
jgi:hypothetical protein